MKLAVVGGGMAGLAAAWEAERLARDRGLDLELRLYEASGRLGGHVETLHEDGFIVEAGADAFVRYKPWALELARKLGLEGEVVGTRPAQPALVVAGGRARPLPAGLNVVVPGRLGALVASSLLSPRGKARALGDLLLPRGAGGDEPFGAFVSRRLGRELWERLAAPLVGGIYGGDPARLSTEAAFPQLLELERRHRSLLMGSRHVLRARGEPARGGLFASLAEGLGRLAEGVAARLERTVLELATPVRRLSDLDADAAVLAVPAYAAADILADTAPEAAVALREIPYADSVSATLAFPADGFPTVAGHGVLFAAGEGGGVRGFTWVDRKWAGRAPEDYRLVRAFLEGDSEPVEWALAALERLLGRVPAPERTWVFSRSRAMPQYTLGHPARLRAVEAGLAKLPGVEVAGAAYRGVGVPDVIRDGREAAARAIAHLEGSSTQSRVRWSQKARPA